MPVRIEVGAKGVPGRPGVLDKLSRVFRQEVGSRRVSLECLGDDPEIVGGIDDRRVSLNKLKRLI